MLMTHFKQSGDIGIFPIPTSHLHEKNKHIFMFVLPHYEKTEKASLHHFYCHHRTLVFHYTLNRVKVINDLTKLRRQRQRERQKSSTFIEQNDNSARASRFLVHLLAVPAQVQREIRLS